jgi:hypothetical protein
MATHTPRKLDDVLQEVDGYAGELGQRAIANGADRISADNYTEAMYRVFHDRLSGGDGWKFRMYDWTTGAYYRRTDSGVWEVGFARPGEKPTGFQEVQNFRIENFYGNGRFQFQPGDNSHIISILHSDNTWSNPWQTSTGNLLGYLQGNSRYFNSDGSMRVNPYQLTAVGSPETGYTPPGIQRIFQKAGADVDLQTAAQMARYNYLTGGVSLESSYNQITGNRLGATGSTQPASLGALRAFGTGMSALGDGLVVDGARTLNPAGLAFGSGLSATGRLIQGLDRFRNADGGFSREGIRAIMRALLDENR